MLTLLFPQFLYTLLVYYPPCLPHYHFFHPHYAPLAFFQHFLLMVSSTTNILPRRLLLFRQDGNHIQKCPFVSRAVSLFLSNSLFTKPEIRKLIFHDLRIRLLELFMLSLAKQKTFTFYQGFKYSVLSTFGVGESKIFCNFNSCCFRDNPKTVNTMSEWLQNVVRM